MPRAKKRRTDGPSLDDETPIWEFIYDIVCNMELQEEVTEELFRQYREENPTVQWTVQQLFDYFNDHMRSTLYKCDLPGYKILSLYKSLEIEISEHTETILEMRFSAVLRVNSDRVLEHFSFLKSASQPNPHDFPKSCSPEPNRSSEQLERQRPDRSTTGEVEPEHLFTDKFEEKLWKYINLYNTEVTGNSIMSLEFYENMISRSPSIPVKSAPALLNHFREKMIGGLLKQALCPKLKLRLYKELRIPMAATEKEWFLQNERIEISVSADGILENWTYVSRMIEDRWDTTQELLDPPKTPNTPTVESWSPRRKTRSPSPMDQQPSSSSVPASQARPGRNIATWDPPRRAPWAPRLPSQLSISPPPPPRAAAPSKPVSRPKAAPPAPSAAASSSSEHHRAPRAAREKPKRVPFFLTDQVEAWKHVYEKMKKAERLKRDPVLPKGKVFWEDYVRNTNTTKNAGNWSSHFRKQMCPTLQEMPFRREKMLFLYKNIDIEVDEKVHKILERKCNARIKLSSNRNVKSWKFLDEHEEEEEVEDPNDSEDSEDPEDPQDPQAPEDPKEAEEELNAEVEEEAEKEADEQLSSCDTTQPLDSEQLPEERDVQQQQQEEEEEEEDHGAPQGQETAESRYAVQQAVEELGDNAIDRMEESVKAAFGGGGEEKDQEDEDEVTLDADGMRELVERTVRNSELDEDEKTRILSRVDHLTAKILESMGIIENRDVFEVSERILKTSLEAKLREMAKKQSMKQETADKYIY